MTDNNLNEIAGGFYADCVACYRMPCDVESVYNEACSASEDVTRKTDFFLSMFEFPELFLQEIATTGKAKNYLGVCWGRFLVIDIDREGDLESAVRDTAKLVDYMVTTFGLKPENIQIWFSGKKGFHVSVSTQIFGKAATPSVAFHNFCKTVAERIGKEAGVVIDGSIYDNVRLLRCGNTRHGKTGLFKTPVKYEELTDANAVENICQRAESPRRLLDVNNTDCVACDDDVTYSPITTCNPVAAQFWRDAMTPGNNRYVGHNASYSQRPSSNYTGGSQQLRKKTKNYIQNGAQKGERAMELFKAAADCYRNGMPEEKIKSELTVVGLRDGLSMNEVTRQIQCGIDNQKRQGGCVTANTPQDFAMSYIASLPGLVRVYSAGEWFDYDSRNGWCLVSESIVKAEITNFLRQAIERQSFGVQKPNVTRWMIQDVTDNVQAMLTVKTPTADTLDTTVWLRFEDGCLRAEPADGWIATRSHLLHVPRVATALYRGEKIPEDAIRPVDSSLFTTGMVPCDFNEYARCSRWLQFVSESCPGDASMLRMMFGLSLTYDRRFNVFFVLFGEAGTGKSTAMNVLASLNAGTVCGVSLGLFGERFQVMPLTRNRVNIVQDMDSIFEGHGSVSKREAVLKSCTAGEKIQVEQKYKPTEYRFLCALSVFGCNTTPRFADRSDAVSDRMRIIPFPNVFRDTEKQDISLGEKLREELSGVLLWALRGYGELLDSDSPVFPETEYSSTLKRDAIKASRPEELFCDEMLEKVDLNVSLPTEYVHARYLSYCKERGHATLTDNIVLPKIQKYLDVEKKKVSNCGERKMSFVGVAFVGQAGRAITAEQPVQTAEIQDSSSQ